MRFEFATTTRIIFGDGTLQELAPLATGGIPRGATGHALVACGRSMDRVRPVLDLLAEAGIHTIPFIVPGEPTVELVEEGVRLARHHECNLVVGFGGGSALDAAKAVAILATNHGEPLDYLEVIGRGQSLSDPPIPCIAIPTTAGTGSEVTRNAVLASGQHKVKVSLRSPLMLPRLAIVDPELTHDLPPRITATTGMDALTQLIEPFVSIRANPMTDALCREGITRAARSLVCAYRDGRDADARADMSIASMFGGMALANAGLGAVHGFAGPIGGMFTAPHGAICAAILPHAMAANVRALREHQAHGNALARYDELGRLLTGHAGASADDAVACTQQLAKELRIPSLASYGIKAEDVPAIVEKAAAASSMKGNPVMLPPDELEQILTAAL